MFGWKPHGKEEAAAAPMVQPPLGGSSTAGVAPVADLATLDSAASSLCSLDGLELPSSTAISSSMCSLELITPSNSGVLPRAFSSSASSVVAAGCPPHRPLERASVKSKAAYFEALCRANTTLHIQCSSKGTQHSSYPSDGGSGAAPGDALVGDADMVHADSDEEVGCSWQDFSEVHLRLRMPRGPSSTLPGSSSKYGSVAQMEQLLEQLQKALEMKEAQRRAAVDAFTRRSAEVDNLQRVVRELSGSRAKAATHRAMLADKYADLQEEYHRMLRIADLSRTVSKENVAATSRTRSELRRVQSELHATKSHALNLNEKNKKAKVENALLKEKVQLLERLDFEEVQESECKKHFTRYRLAETY